VNRIAALTLIAALFISSTAMAKNVAFLVIDGDSYLADQAVSDLGLPDSYDVRVFTHQDLIENGPTEKYLSDAKVILVDVMSDDLTRYLLENNLATGRDVYVLRGSRDDKGLEKAGFIFNSEVKEYFDHLSKNNLTQMIRRAINLSLDRSVTYEEPVPLPDLGIYHPDASGVFTSYEEFLAWAKARPDYQADRPTVGLMLFSSSLVPGQVECIDHTIRRLERAGFSVLACFGKDEDVLTRFFMDENKKPRVDMVVSFSLKFYSAINDKVKEALIDLDTPVVNAINLYSQNIDAWRADPAGISPMDVVWTVATPEISGSIEPTPLSGKKEIVDEQTGRRFFVHRPVDELITLLIPRLHGWVRLRQKPNNEKKTAILYYNHSPGKQNIGASYLNVFRSLELILERMRQDGYRVPTDVELTEDDISAMIQRTGRNVGSWAPGELDALLKEDKLVRVKVDEYAKWFARLPKDFQDAVIRQWGPPESSAIMTKGGFLIIPAVVLDNVVLLPEPSRGWSDDPMKLYHDPEVYPHHQYIAAYLWLKYGFQTDAMIHLGTHATHEWLPGKQAGLSPACPPEVLITDIPNLYPYIVDDVGEGIQAKRRGRGVIIDHLTPSLKTSGLYNEYDELRSLVQQYSKAASMDAQTAAVYLEQLEELAQTMGLDKDLGLQTFDAAAVEQIDLYLHDIEDTHVPYGMHTFGRAPDGDALSGTVQAVLDSNPDLDPEDVKARLVKSGSQEIDRLMAGLAGRYIPAGEGNDPIRNPAALPTGKNFYGFSPAKIPSPAAWELGRKAGDEIIRNHLDNHGKYPEKPAVVLWATETLRNEGVNESTILYLMGLKPVWDQSGRVKGTEVIPAAQLKRPRIDVLINPSGLYRDLFPDKLIFLDKAVQKAAAQTDIENLISKHSRAMKEQLLKQGLKEDAADKLSRVRIFTEKPGAYGNRVSEMTTASGFWEDDGDIAEVFERQTGFAYGLGLWGEPSRQALNANLKDADVAIHSISSNVFGTMDNDDLFASLGGLSLAIRKASGRNPETLISMQRDPTRTSVEDIAKTVGQELRSRYLNPKWIEGMKSENYAGARAMSNFVEYMWGWQVTVPEAMDEARWEQTYEVYVKDKYDQKLPEFFNDHNPWAYQSITARMLEAVRKGYWDAGEDVKKTLAAEYAMNVISKGVACCDHTCNNPMLNQMVVSIISLPGVMSPELVEEFKLAIEKMAGKPLEDQVENQKQLMEALSRSLDKKPEQTKDDPKQADNKDAESQDKSVEGYRMEEIKSDDETSKISSSGVQWFAALLVLGLIGLFAWGAGRYRR
jgi:cobaltochelatase CobN